MSVKIVSTMGVKDVGGSLGAMIKEMETGDERMVVTIFGKANGVSYRSNKFGDVPSKALIGTFEGIPVDPSRDSVRSSRAFLPSNIQNILIAAVEGENIDEKLRPKKAPPIGKGIDLEGVKVVSFVVEVGIRKITTDEGDKYEYICAMPDKPEENDELADQRAEVLKLMKREVPPAPKQIAAPKKTVKGKK